MSQYCWLGMFVGRIWTNSRPIARLSSVGWPKPSASSNFVRLSHRRSRLERDSFYGNSCKGLSTTTRQRSFNWQSTAFVMRGLWVRLPSLALLRASNLPGRFFPRARAPYLSMRDFSMRDLSMREMAIREMPSGTLSPGCSCPFDCQKSSIR